MTIFKRGTKSQIIGIGFQAFPQNDVDGSGDGPSARFGGRGSHDFDLFNHLWREGLNGKSRGYALAIQQNLGIAATQSAHANATASPGCTLNRHARQALEHLTQSAVALFVQFFTANHNFGCCGLSAFFGDVVSVGLDFYATHVLSRRT